jgi:PEP-CTERM motif
MKHLAVFSAALLGSIWLTPSHAAVLSTGVQTFTESFNFELSEGQNFSGGGAELLFPYFDASLGTLTEVRIRAKLTIDSDLFLQGRGQSPELEPVVDVNAQIDMIVQLNSPGFSNGSVLSSSTGGGVACNLPFEASCNVSGAADGMIDDTVIYDPLQALEFIGTGNFKLGLSANGVVNVNVDSQGGASFSSQHVGSVFGEAEVIYTYDPVSPASVPEPGSLALLAFGGLGASVARKRLR